jgi:hypothetical protein
LRQCTSICLDHAGVDRKPIAEIPTDDADALVSFEDANELVDMLNRQDREIDRTARQLVSITTCGMAKAARPRWSA